VFTCDFAVSWHSFRRRVKLLPRLFGSAPMRGCLLSATVGLPLLALSGVDVAVALLGPFPASPRLRRAFLITRFPWFGSLRAACFSPFWPLRAYASFRAWGCSVVRVAARCVLSSFWPLRAYASFRASIRLSRASASSPRQPHPAAAAAAAAVAVAAAASLLGLAPCRRRSLYRVVVAAVVLSHLVIGLRLFCRTR
jgi:hypothetical protein